MMKVTAEDPLYKCSQLCDGHVLRYCAKHVDEALTLARANADELFVISVDCELGSGCRKDRTCSGASHWQTHEQIAQEEREEAIQESLKVRSCEDCYASGAESMLENCKRNVLEYINEKLKDMPDLRKSISEGISSKLEAMGKV